MEQMVNDILNWISANPHWAGFAVFAIAFFESLAIIGLAVPGWLLLVGVGSLVGAGHLNFWLMSLASFIGAASGQMVSYSVGYYFNERVHQWPWVKRHESMMHKAEGFFQRHGFSGILIGQFIGPIRAVISLVAGVLRMSIKHFVGAVVLATLIWAPVYLMPGVLVGAALTFEKQQMWVLLVSILLLLIPLWLLIRYLWDQYKVYEKPQALATKRHWIALLMSAILILVVSFLVTTEYGALMLDLANKIWGVIS